MAKLCLAFRGRPIQAHHFEENTGATIGSDPGCAIVIDSLAVAPQHAKIVTTKYNCRLISLNEAFPTLVNHNPVTERYLSHGDIVQIGKHTLTFAEDEQAVGLMPTNSSRAVTRKHNSSAMTKEEIAALEEPLHCESCVQIVNGKHFGKVIPMDHGLVRLGNTGKTTAAIAHRRDGYFLSHLEGKTPPKINGQSIGEHSHQLFDGDTIRIGNVRMIFHLRSSTAQTRIAAIREA